VRVLDGKKNLAASCLIFSISPGKGGSITEEYGRRDGRQEGRRELGTVSDDGGEKMRKSFRRSRWLFTAVAVVVLALVSTACGSGSGKTTTTISTTTTTKVAGY
jgi:hypothetical protein